MKRKDIAKFFEMKLRSFFKKKKPQSKNYPYQILDPYHVVGEQSGFENFYLVGDNWQSEDKKPIAILWKFNDWKLGFSSDYLPEYRTAFAPRRLKGGLTILSALRKLVVKPDVFIVWGYEKNRYLDAYAKFHNIPVFRMEDGFVRSSALGASHSTPYSLVLDRTGLYYNCQEPSDLENILNNYDFKTNPELLIKAQECISTLVRLNLSKYNPPELPSDGLNAKIKTRKRVAILGQVDNDASIRYGNPDSWQVEDLIRLAKYENPEAEVIYRPHPEVYKGYQQSSFKRKNIDYLATIMPPDEPLIEFLNSIDHVYTITSLSGFEALLRGIKVTCVGVPFYAGWGLTDDRVKVERRTARLSLVELFAGAYLLYPRYLGNLDDSYVGLNAACFKIIADREIGRTTTCNHLLRHNFEDAIKVAKTNHWPKIIFDHKDKLDSNVISKIFAEIDFSKVFYAREGCCFYQTIILFLISGALPDNVCRSIFIDNVRSYVNHSILNDLLLYLNQYFPGEYLVTHFSWLLTEKNECELAKQVLIREAENLRRDHAALNEDFFDNQDEVHSDHSHKVSEFLEDECDLWIEILEKSIVDRDLDKAIEFIKPLLLSTYSHTKVLKVAISIAEMKFDYESVVKLSQFSQGINVFFSNRLAIMAEMRASTYVPLECKDQYLNLFSKVISLKPDKIANIMLNVRMFPDLFDEEIINSMFEGMLLLDSEISARKCQAFMAIERPDKAEMIMEQIIAGGDNSDNTRILYSQALSFNGKLDEAFETMAISRALKLTTSNIHESLRLCVLDGRYSFSLDLLRLADKYLIPLGEMHKRKAFFGNRMLKDAFETFTEIQIVKTVAKYFKDKYYRFEEELQGNESVFALTIFGPGDEIRFASIYNMLSDVLNVQDIRVACSPRLIEIFSRSFRQLTFVPVARPRNSDIVNLSDYSDVPGSDIIGVVDNNAVKAIETSDRILFVTDLLSRCLPDYNAFPGVAYLKADEGRAQGFKQRLPDGVKLVGLNWRSSLTTHSRNEHYLTIEELEPLFTIPDVIFVNLQYDECGAELSWVHERYPDKLYNLDDVDQYNDFDSVAALMSCLDLVIAAATTVVELAGALGCPTWLFSNSSELDWRKIDAIGTDVWHNNTTIVEGEILGDKTSLVKEIRTRLIENLKSNFGRNAA
jgi:capsular polysaccharide export protein